ncbi:MAG TPA: GntR family transcriptional regulator [Pseudonocardiaceae bacterium]|jgi:DNA-binding transcriptional regulator YhcF (GntR family)|nr:GntR family transcriptional regulator [Pseudonocardiaceae bacterium]
MTTPADRPVPSLQVDLSSPVPPYEQLRAQLAGLIGTGGLRAGDRLPSVRQLAADLGLAGGTVARAYRQLDQAGLVEGKGRHGTVVRSDPTVDAEQRGHRQELAAAAERLVRTARDLGLSDEAALAALRAALARPRDTTQPAN